MFDTLAGAEPPMQLPLSLSLPPPHRHRVDAGGNGASRRRCVLARARPGRTEAMAVE